MKVLLSNTQGQYSVQQEKWGVEVFKSKGEGKGRDSCGHLPGTSITSALDLDTSTAWKVGFSSPYTPGNIPDFW